MRHRSLAGTCRHGDRGDHEDGADDSAWSHRQEPTPGPRGRSPDRRAGNRRPGFARSPAVALDPLIRSWPDSWPRSFGRDGSGPSADSRRGRTTVVRGWIWHEPEATTALTVPG